MPGSNTSVRQRKPASPSCPAVSGRSAAIRDWWARRSLRSTVAWPSPTSRPVRRRSSWAWKRRVGTATLRRRGVAGAPVGLAFAALEAGQAPQLLGVEAAVGHRHLEPQGAAVGGGRLQGQLVDGEAELVEPSDPGLDLIALVAAEGLGVGELVPQGPVAGGDALGRGQVLVDPLAALAQLHGDVDQVPGDVLDQDV